MKKKLEAKDTSTPPPYTEGYWEDFMLENSSYYDIDILEKHNAPIRKKLKYWEEEFKPTGNMGKWWASLQVQKLKKKLKHYTK